MNDKDNTRGIATFAAGCFWSVQAQFDDEPGVLNTTVGYMGGETENPSYDEVCTDKTGHAEVVQVKYDPEKTSYEKLLDVFWNIHDPTQLNKQGPDVGTQYRSAVFYNNEDQKTMAEKSLNHLQRSGKHKKDIVTEITKADVFTPAEDYHQKYLEKKGLKVCH